MPQGTVFGSSLFSIFVNNIKTVNPRNLLIKYANDISFSMSVTDVNSSSDSKLEVQSLIKWTENDKVKVNLKKTWELLVSGKTSSAF